MGHEMSLRIIIILCSAIVQSFIHSGFLLLLSPSGIVCFPFVVVPAVGGAFPPLCLLLLLLQHLELCRSLTGQSISLLYCPPGFISDERFAISIGEREEGKRKYLLCAIVCLWGRMIALYCITCG